MKRQVLDSDSAGPLRRRRARVAIALAPRCWAGSVYLAQELLQIAGTLRARNADLASSALFDTTLVGATTRAVPSFAGPALKPQATVRDGACFDVVIVPAQFMPTGETDADEARLCAWLQRQHAAGALLVSLGGAVLLAKTGLLDGGEATGLLSERKLFERHFPRVRYTPSRRIVARGQILTVCGIGPTADACAHVIERFFGPAPARRFLRYTSSEVMPAQEQLGLWSARYKRHRDAPVLAAQEIVERELHALPPAAHLAAQVGLSERALSRRWAEATGLPLRAYVAALRLELAETLLRSTDMALAHIAGECGFASDSAFNRAFRQRFGVPPRRYRLQARQPTG
jgi:transcriptional regulator GlxA family with amidase domain